MKIYFALSLALIVPGVIFMGLGGLKYNVEFLGGVEALVALPPGAPTSSKALNDMLEAKGLHSPNTKITAGPNGYEAAITLPLKAINPDLAALVDSSNTEDKLKAQVMIASAVGADSSIVEKQIGTGAASRTVKSILGFEHASETVRKETWLGAIWGVIFSSVLIVLWLTIR